MVMEADSRNYDMLFGRHRPRILMNSLRKMEAGTPLPMERAQMVLDAFTHEEIRHVVDSLEAQMADGGRKARYDNELDSSHWAAYACGRLGLEDSGRVILFTDRSYEVGFVNALERLIAAAHPEYHPVTSPLCTLTFERN